MAIYVEWEFSAKLDDGDCGKLVPTSWNRLKRLRPRVRPRKAVPGKRGVHLFRLFSRWLSVIAPLEAVLEVVQGRVVEAECAPWTRQVVL